MTIPRTILSPMAMSTRTAARETDVDVGGRVMSCRGALRIRSARDSIRSSTKADFDAHVERAASTFTQTTWAGRACRRADISACCRPAAEAALQSIEAVITRELCLQHGALANVLLFESFVCGARPAAGRNQAGPTPMSPPQLASDKQIEPTVSHSYDRMTRTGQLAKTLGDPLGAPPCGASGLVAFAAVEKPHGRIHRYAPFDYVKPWPGGLAPSTCFAKPDSSWRARGTPLPMP